MSLWLGLMLVRRSQSGEKTDGPPTGQPENTGNGGKRLGGSTSGKAQKDSAGANRETVWCPHCRVVSALFSPQRGCVLQATPASPTLQEKSWVWRSQEPLGGWPSHVHKDHEAPAQTPDQQHGHVDAGDQQLVEEAEVHAPSPQQQQQHGKLELEA